MINIHSIFESISGESGPVIRQGEWTTFIRTSGCNLCCDYCDTKDAQELNSGLEMAMGEIMGRCCTKNILITGGEPLIWEEAMPKLIQSLARAGHTVQVETNGTYPPPIFHENVGYAIDIKCPCSGEAFRMPLPGDLPKERAWTKANLDLKFVVKSQADVDFAIPYVEKMRYQKGRAVFSPINAGKNLGGSLEIGDILDAVRKINMLDKLVISLQLHKILDMP